jgi:hypothetical protein
MLRRAEGAGFHTAWVAESQLGDAASLEPFSVLSFATAHTVKIRLGIAVAVLPLHQPVRLARTVATIESPVRRAPAAWPWRRNQRPAARRVWSQGGRAGGALLRNTSRSYARCGPSVR